MSAFTARLDCTKSAYRSDFANFSDWCQQRNLSPFQVSAEQLAEYIEHLAPTLRCSSVERRIACIGTILRLSNLPNITREPECVLALKRMQRRKGNASRQAVPLTREVLKQLLAVCTDSTRGHRDRVMLLLGYETMRGGWQSESTVMRYLREWQALESIKHID